MACISRIVATGCPHVKRTNVDMLVRDRKMRSLAEDWHRHLENDKDISIDEIMMATSTGRPAGDQTFTETFVQLTSRSLQKGKPGRPGKQELQDNGVVSPE
jgi:hypothetical protein